MLTILVNIIAIIGKSMLFWKQAYFYRKGNLIYKILFLIIINAFKKWIVPMNQKASNSFETVLTVVAPLAILLVVGVAGVRLVIKLFNRGVGK
jgi:hypothetical protein